MKKPIITTLLVFVQIISLSKNTTVKLDGWLDDVSPNKQWILYRTADYWGPDELHVGSLKAFNVKTKEDILIAGAFLENPSNFFLNDSLVVIPAQGCIKLYNLNKKSFEKKPLLTFNKEYQFLQFSLNDDRTKAAILCRDYKNRMENKEQDRRYDRIELKVVDLIHQKGYIVEHYTYDHEASVYNISNILWHKDQLVYSFQSQLYYYQLGNPQRILLTNHMSAYAIDGNNLIFASNVGNTRQMLQSFSFDDLSIKKLEFEGKEFIALLFDPQQFYTTNIYNKKHAVLSGYMSLIYYGRGDSNKFKELDKLILHKSKNLCIEQTFENVKMDDGMYDTKPVLIINF